MPAAGLGDKIAGPFNNATKAQMSAAAGVKFPADKVSHKQSLSVYDRADMISKAGPKDDKLGLIDSYNKQFYEMCANTEFDQITKKHSFRSFVNTDRDPQTGSDIQQKVRRKQERSSINNSPSLKFSLQEYAPSIEAEKKNLVKVRRKSDVRTDLISGVVTRDAKAGKMFLEPQSNTMQTYYDMLITQKKPFNLRKGSLVTADSIKRLDLH